MSSRPILGRSGVRPLAEESADFREVEAAGYDVFDAFTGNLVTSFDSRDEVFVELPEVLRSNLERSDDLLVFALDSKGHTLASWPASELLVSG